MRKEAVNLKRHLAALAVLLLPSGAVWADSDASILLQKLRSATEAEAPMVERDLVTNWSRSGSAAMDLLLQRGRDAMEADAFGLAIEHFTALTDHAPDFAEGYHLRAQAYYQAGLYGPALDDLERALALNPNNFNAIFGLAIMLEEFGEKRRAAVLLRKVLAIHPNHAQARSALGALERDGIGRAL